MLQVLSCTQNLSSARLNPLLSLSLFADLCHADWAHCSCSLRRPNRVNAALLSNTRFSFVEPHCLRLVYVRKSAGNARLVLKILPFRACITKTMNVHHILFFLAKMVCASPYRFVDCFHQEVSSFSCKRGKLFLLHKRPCIKARELRFALYPVNAGEFQQTRNKDDLMPPGKTNDAVFSSSMIKQFNYFDRDPSRRENKYPTVFGKSKKGISPRDHV